MTLFGRLWSSMVANGNPQKTTAVGLPCGSDKRLGSRICKPNLLDPSALHTKYLRIGYFQRLLKSSRVFINLKYK